jgi:hypothetical protein
MTLRRENPSFQLISGDIQPIDGKIEARCQAADDAGEHSGRESAADVANIARTQRRHRVRSPRSRRCCAETPFERGLLAAAREPFNHRIGYTTCYESIFTRYRQLLTTTPRRCVAARADSDEVGRAFRLMSASSC